MSNTNVSKEMEEVLAKINALPSFSEKLNESDRAKLKKVLLAHKDRMADRVWRRTDKVVSTIVIGGPGVEVMPNTLASWLNPKVWLAKLMISIHSFLYRNVASFGRRAWASGKMIVIPIHKGLVDYATGKRKKPQRKGLASDQHDFNRAIINRLDDLKDQVKENKDTNLMKALEDAIKKNTNN